VGPWGRGGGTVAHRLDEEAGEDAGENEDAGD
jgi:hypothetical protein